MDNVLIKYKFDIGESHNDAASSGPKRWGKEWGGWVKCGLGCTGGEGLASSQLSVPQTIEPRMCCSWDPATLGGGGGWGPYSLKGVRWREAARVWVWEWRVAASQPAIHIEC